MKFKLTAILSGLLITNVVSAATVIDLKNQPANFLQNNLNANSFSLGKTQIKELRTEVDRNQITHKRIQQTYNGIPVWRATGVIHTTTSNNRLNKTSMNGVVYQGLEKDLSNTPAYALSDSQKEKAISQAKLIYEKTKGLKNLSYKKQDAQTIIYLDDSKQAHYGYLISLTHDDGNTGAHKPTMILNAETLNLYHQWDEIYTADGDPQLVGGIGGNTKTGPLIYDNSPKNLPASAVQVFQEEIEVLPKQKVKLNYCFLNNAELAIQDVAYASDDVAAPCLEHNGLFWLSNDLNFSRWKDDEANGGFSPSLDALYAGTVINKFYKEWYGIPALVEKDGKTPMKLIMRVHYGRNFDNAFWDGEQMTFGDGGSMFYPLTSLDVGAHEISHGFTQQHSGLNGEYNQMGALHESFSDMAAAAAEFYTTGKNSWKLGSTITKVEGTAIRYLDDPKKDGLSLDNLNDYQEGMDPHLLGGIFNKAFYLIATTKGWDTHRAFDIMVQANRFYWTSSMQTFQEAACGVVSATNDLQYNVADVRVAFAKVGIDTDKC